MTVGAMLKLSLNHKRGPPPNWIEKSWNWLYAPSRHRCAFIGIVSGGKIFRGHEIAHLALQLRLPGDGQVSQLLRVADVTPAAELGKAEVPSAPPVIRGAGHPEIPAQNRRRFNAVAHRVSQIVDLAGVCARAGVAASNNDASPTTAQPPRRIRDELRICIHNGLGRSGFAAHGFGADGLFPSRANLRARTR